MNLTEILNTREMSSIIWVLLIFIYAASKSRGVIESFISMIKLATTGILLEIFTLMALYVLLVVLVILQLNLGFPTLIKDAIAWFFGTGIVLMMKANKAVDLKFFKGVFVDSIKLSVIITFVVQLYTFNIIVELILVPFLVLITGMNALSKYKKEYETFTSYMLGIIGISYLVYSSSHILNDFQSFTTYNNLASFSLPIIMTILFMPFLYVLALFLIYDELIGRHGRLRFVLERNSNKHINYIVGKIIKSCNINVTKWNKFKREFANQLFNKSNKEEIDEIFINFNK